MKDLLYLLALPAWLGSCHGGETCYDYSDWPTSKYCNDGCCGTFPYEYCCEPVSVSVSDIEIPVIIGISVGSVIGGLLLISFIVCIICVCIKQKGKPGRVIAPQGTVQSAVFTTSSSYPTQGYYNPVHFSFPQPPSYSQPTSAPPPYGIAAYAPTYQTSGSSSLSADGNPQGNNFPPQPQAFYNNQTTQQYQ